MVQIQRTILGALCLLALACERNPVEHNVLPASITPIAAAIPEKTLGDSVVEFARTQIGVRELTGHNDGVEVEAYLRSTGLSRGFPYCAAFQHYCFRQCGHVLKPIGPFASAAHWHQQAHRIWEARTWKPDIGEFKPVGKPGDLVGYFFPKLNRIAHTEVYEKDTPDWVYTVGANTSDDAGVVRDGGGVFARKRLKKQCTCISRWL